MKQWKREALEQLQTYSWPGNIRELRNFVERLVIMSTGDTIMEEEVLRVLPTSQPDVPAQAFSQEADRSLKERVEAYERELLISEFKKAGGNVSLLSRTLNIDRANLHRKLKSYGIK